MSNICWGILPSLWIFWDDWSFDKFWTLCIIYEGILILKLVFRYQNLGYWDVKDYIFFYIINVIKHFFLSTWDDVIYKSLRDNFDIIDLIT